MKITIVDKNDKVIGYRERNILRKDDIYRVSALWITNSRGDILLAKRHHTKSHHPGKWGPAVAGTIEKGETYESNIIKEMREELGINNLMPKLGPRMKMDNEFHYFIQWYVLSIDKEVDEFKIQKEEVEEIKWFSPRELTRELREHPEDFLPAMGKYFKLFLSHSSSE